MRVVYMSQQMPALQPAFCLLFSIALACKVCELHVIVDAASSHADTQRALRNLNYNFWVKDAVLGARRKPVELFFPNHPGLKH